MFLEANLPKKGLKDDRFEKNIKSLPSPFDNGFFFARLLIEELTVWLGRFQHFHTPSLLSSPGRDKGPGDAGRRSETTSMSALLK